MIPKINDDLRQDFTEAARQPSLTYRMELARDRVRGKTDELEAVRQAVYKILRTERYDYAIYSWNYGVELADLIGAPVSYAAPEVKRRVTEALTQDDRIESVDSFDIESGRGRVHAAFTVHTIFGDLRAEKEAMF